jgi:hypothetical protein
MDYKCTATNNIAELLKQTKERMGMSHVIGDAMSHVICSLLVAFFHFKMCQSKSC